MEYFASYMVIAIKSFTYMKIIYKYTRKKNIHRIINASSIKNEKK